MSGAGVMPGRHYIVTPITLNLSAARLNPRVHNVLPVRHHQQLQYEPDSAKCFLYRTQMHLQSHRSHGTLPDIKPKTYNLEEAQYERFSTVEELTTEKPDDLLPHLRRTRHEAQSRQSLASRSRGSRYSVGSLDSEDEAQTIRRALHVATRLQQQTPPVVVGSERQTPAPSNSPVSDTENDGDVCLQQRHLMSPLDLRKRNTSATSYTPSDRKPNPQGKVSFTLNEIGCANLIAKKLVLTILSV